MESDTRRRVARWASWLRPAAILRFLAVVVFTALAYEAVLRLGLAYLPTGMLTALPDRVRWSYPDERLERPYFRPIRRSELVDDPDLGFRYAPNLSIRLIYPDVDYAMITDSKGFANRDETLYAQADLVVLGDSFSMGMLVEPDEVWPQRLAQKSGRRVLNLAATNWDVYQYPRAARAFGRDARPRVVIASLTTYVDLDPRYYEYEDYRHAHPDVRGYLDYRDRTAQRFQWRPLEGTRYASFLLGNAKEAVRGSLPFAVTSLAYLRRIATVPPVARFELNGHEIAYRFDPELFTPGFAVYPPERVSLDRVRRDLAAIRAYAAEQGATLRFLYLPSPDEIYLPQFGAARPLNAPAEAILERLRSARLDFERHVKIWQELAGDAVIWDITSHLQARAAGSAQLTPMWDFHLLAPGHQAIADYVADRLGELEAAPDDRGASGTR